MNAQTKVFRVLESRDTSCMLRKRHSQRDKVVRKYGAWRMLSCKHCCVRCVCVESRLLEASSGLSKLEYDASVSCHVQELVSLFSFTGFR